MTMDVREIVARLKGHSEIMERDKGKFVRFIDVATCTEAVDVIEALAAEIERLRTYDAHLKGEYIECERCCGNGQTYGPNSGGDIICPDCEGTGRHD